MSGETTNHVILHYLDEPIRFLYWTKGELCLYFGIPFIGFVIEEEITSFALLAIGIFMRRFFKKRFGKVNLQIFRYWYFPPDKRNSKLPRSHIRTYLG